MYFYANYLYTYDFLYKCYTFHNWRKIKVYLFCAVKIVCLIYAKNYRFEFKIQFILKLRMTKIDSF